MPPTRKGNQWPNNIGMFENRKEDGMNELQERIWTEIRASRVAVHSDVMEVRVYQSGGLSISPLAWKSIGCPKYATLAFAGNNRESSELLAIFPQTEKVDGAWMFTPGGIGKKQSPGRSQKITVGSALRGTKFHIEGKDIQQTYPAFVEDGYLVISCKNRIVETRPVRHHKNNGNAK